MPNYTTENNSKLGFLGAALAAEPLFEVAGYTVTNAMTNAWASIVFFIIIAFITTRRKGLVPKGVHNLIEALVAFVRDEIQKVTEDERKTKMFIPLVATIFFFVLVNNWMGLIPGTGTIGIYGESHGALALIPLLRPATADLNLTLAIAVVSIGTTHYFGMKELGAFNHISKFLNFKGIFQSIKKGPMAIVVSFVEFGIGLIEIVGEFAKTLSLSLRLFGNVFAGEILLTVMLSLFSYVLPVPFMFLEILVGVIQATVFAMLTLAFLVVATLEHGHDDHDEHEDDIIDKDAHIDLKQVEPAR